MTLLELDIKATEKQFELFPPLREDLTQLLMIIYEFEKKLVRLKKDKIKITEIRDHILEELKPLSQNKIVIPMEEARKKINLKADLKELNKWLFENDQFIYKSELGIQFYKSNLFTL